VLPYLRETGRSDGRIRYVVEILLLFYCNYSLILQSRMGGMITSLFLSDMSRVQSARVVGIVVLVMLVVY
jgi:hypothetical protein